jgi:transcriptional regulator with XRE-family HTH domain
MGCAMSSVGERLAEAARQFGGVDALAEAAGISRTTLYNYCSGHTEIRVSALAEIARVTGLSINWLVTGRAENSSVSSSVDLPKIKKIIWNIAYTFWKERTRSAKPEDVADQVVEMLEYLISREAVGDEASQAVIQFGAERLKRSSPRAE